MYQGSIVFFCDDNNNTKYCFFKTMKLFILYAGSNAIDIVKIYVWRHHYFHLNESKNNTE